MAKIATAHIEIKPVLNDEAMQEVLRCIEEAVSIGFQRGVEAYTSGLIQKYGDPAGRTPEEIAEILRSLGHNLDNGDRA